jgi:hypothetical protein
MKTYARIDNGIVAELFETDGDITEMFHPDLQWIDITAMSPAPQPGWTYSGSAFAEPAGPSAAELWAVYQSRAQALLNESDRTVIRCYEASTPLPETWVTYRKALRAIVGAESGDPTQPLPSKPEYPAGT